MQRDCAGAIIDRRSLAGDRADLAQQVTGDVIDANMGRVLRARRQRGAGVGEGDRRPFTVMVSPTANPVGNELLRAVPDNSVALVIATGGVCWLVAGDPVMVLSV
jgi:hypothetical protein